MYNSKIRRRIAIIIAIVLVAAMVIPLIVSAF